jgi:toxin ParE1/3/4
MKKVVFLVTAESETAKAAEFYKKQQKDLGNRFIFAVEEAAVRIRLNPLSYPILEGDLRRCLLTTFPFGILFRVERSRIVIVAVMHLHRQPGYWKDRVG